MQINNKIFNAYFSPFQQVLISTLLLGLLPTIIIALTIFTIVSQNKENISVLTENAANGTANLIANDLQKRMVSLTLLARLSQRKADMTLDDWQTLGDTLYEAQSGYKAVGWIDGDLNYSQLTPMHRSEDSQDFNLAFNSQALQAAMESFQHKNGALIVPLESRHGVAGIGIYVPIYSRSETKRTFEGYFASLLLVDSYIDAMLPDYLLAQHDFTLSLANPDQGTKPLNERYWNKHASFTLQGKVWKVSIMPKESFLNRTYYKMRRMLTILGGLLSVIFYFAVNRYLTARNKARVILDERNKVEHLLKNLPGMAYQSFNKTDWPMIVVSQGCKQLTGFSKNEFESHSVLFGKLIHRDDYKRVCDSISEALQSKGLYELEYRIISKNNSERLVWERGEAVTSMLDGELILEGFITDITHVRSAEKQLIQSHAFSNAILSSVVEAIITIDHQGRIKSLNKAAQSMFGYSLSEVKDKNIKMLMPRQLAEQHDQYLQNYLHGGEANKVIGKGRELSAKRKDGSVFVAHISISQIESDGELMFVGLLRDITEQQAAAEERRMYIEQMAHTDRLNSLGEMAAGIAHEVNQPLTAISLFSQSGKSLCEQSKFERLPEIFEKLSQHSRRAGAVLERMQVMTKQGLRKRELLDCTTLIDEVAKLAQPDARLRGINIVVRSNKVAALVNVDRVQIQQVLLNLLRNGMEAMQYVDLRNGNTIDLRCEIISNKRIKILVLDSGCGVAEGMIERLFTAFSSTKETGVGIGLSISKSIIEDHGGSIHYAENKTAGSVFYFELPIVEQ